jgi:hypothetical protein
VLDVAQALQEFGQLAEGGHGNLGPNRTSSAALARPAVGHEECGLVAVGASWTSPATSADLDLGMTALGALVYAAVLRGKARPPRSRPSDGRAASPCDGRTCRPHPRRVFPGRVRRT